MTSEEIKKALFRRYGDPRQYLYFEECPVGTGWKGSRYLDAFVIAAWPSANNARYCFEIKTSRADFLNEIKKPEKRRMGLFFSNYFYFVTPKGLVKTEEIPPECGLMELSDSGLRVTVEAPLRESLRPSWNFVAALLRRGVTTRKEDAKEGS